MGILCCKNQTPDGTSMNLLMKSQERNLQRVEASNLSLSDSSDQTNPLLLFELLGADFIASMLKEAEDLLANSDIKNSSPTLDENLKLYNNKIRSWIHLTDLPSGNKLHHYLSEVECPLTPELYYLFTFHLNNERIKQLDDNIDFYELVNYAIKEDIVILVSRTTTKKILMIDPKTFYVVRIIKRIDKDTFIECQKSVDLTPLINHGIFKNYYDELKNVGQVQINAISYTRKGDKFINSAYSKIDVLSGIGPMIVKSAVKPKLKTYQNNLLKRLTQFALETTNYNELIWFTSNYQEIDQIVSENLTLIKESRINLSELDNMSQASFHSQLSERSIKTPSNNIAEEKSQLSIKSQPEKIDDEVVENTPEVIKEDSQTVVKAEISEELKENVETQETPVVEEQVVAEQIPAPVEHNIHCDTTPVEDNANTEQNQVVASEQPPAEEEKQEVVAQDEVKENVPEETTNQNDDTLKNQSETTNIGDSTLVESNITEGQDAVPEETQDTTSAPEKKKKKKNKKK